VQTVRSVGTEVSYRYDALICVVYKGHGENKFLQPDDNHLSHYAVSHFQQAAGVAQSVQRIARGAGQSKFRTPEMAKISRTHPDRYPNSCTVGTGFLSRGAKQMGVGVKVAERVELYHFFPPPPSRRVFMVCYLVKFTSFLYNC